MSWQAKYNIIGKRFTKDDEWAASIEEENYAGSVIELKGTASPIVIEYVNNSEDKFPAIQSSAAKISFVSESFDLESIISNDDKKYRVSIYQGATLQWRGFISTDDCSEAYISGYREYFLTATDGLAFLKEETYKFRTGESGKDAYQKRLLLDCIADCLHYTYTELPIHIQCNVYEDNMTKTGTYNPFDQCKLHTKLFIYADTGPKNMYEALEVIMQAFKCTLFQQYGEWHIKRKLDELETPAAQSKLYAWPTLTTTDVTRRWHINRYEHFETINASHTRSFNKPSGSATVTHNYIIPEIPMNNNFGRGSIVIETSTENSYEVDFWTCVDATLLSGNPPVAGFNRVEEFDVNGNITDVYVTIPAGIPELAELRSEDVAVNKGDYIQITGLARLNQTVASFGQGILYIKLTPDSGPVADYYFVAASGATAAFWDPLNGFPAASIGSGDGLASTEWHPYDVTTLPFPEDGTLSIRYRSFYANPASTGLECHIKDARTTYTISFNGAEIGVIGEQSTASLAITSRKKTEEIIRLGDSPKRVIASGLWRLDDDTLLTRYWGRLADATYTDRLININAEDLQHSSWRVFNKIDGDFMGVTFDSNSKLIGPGNMAIFFPPDNISYIATTMSIDIINDTFNATFQELIDGRVGGKDDGATFFDTTDFKYIYNERS